MKYIFYHMSDHDGKCSGAIVKKYCDENHIPYTLCPIDYGRPMPDVTGKEIIVCDFTFEPKEKMLEAINKSKDMIWIDHHLSSINTYGNMGLKGLRDTQFAACELTWKYFYPTTPMPLGVELLGTYDSWRHEDKPEYIGYEWFLKGMDTSLENFDWNQVFNADAKTIQNQTQKGLLIYEKDSVTWKSQMRNAFKKTVQGESCLILNTQEKGSMVFGKHFKTNDYCIVFYLLPSGVFKHSVYSANKDASEFAKKFGGGGHKGAAGFTTTEMIWN